MRQQADKRLHLVRAVLDARTQLDRGLEDKRRYPREQFDRFFTAVKAYAEASAKEPLLHRDVVNLMNGFRESLELERKRVPGDMLFDADRLETIFFAGYDPLFEGDEPPAL